MSFEIQALALPTEPLIFKPEPRTVSERVTRSDWQQALPVLRGAGFELRELRPSDAASLYTMLTADEVARYITPPPRSVGGFERFVEYAHRRRSQGEFACFAVVPEGLDTAIGIFQVRALDPHFSTAEWGFALGSPFWGRGLFSEGARLVMAFAFEQIGVNRLEARAMAANDRANSALRKVGARKEAVLRQSMVKHGQLHDEHLWAIVETDWRQTRSEAARWRPADGRIIEQPHLSDTSGVWEGVVH
jgi:[ribosomal protein S5]-alanine N-acetyltransferase